jgi:hypothetical protein
MHLLDGAYIRLNRAEEHLTELKSIGTEVVNGEMESVRRTLQMNTQIQPSVGFRFWQPLNAIPPRFAVLIGEVIQNLRTGLDYLVYELAILDSGTKQTRTQFPMEDTQEGFRGRRNSFLKGINDAHVAAIESLQPYNGVNWSKWLRVISNPDKHRHLVITMHQTTFTSMESDKPADSASLPEAANEGGIIFEARFRHKDGYAVYVQYHFAFFIAFDDGLPVIDTLEEIKTQVAQVLADFKPEFQRTQ